ncbi:hypothetical protein ACLUXI_04150 [Bifidobacterium apri]|uniref:hypothetical protein n=1 Tax=Bifidobacterium apri TaxID=1769423 RepID=UPI0039919ADF
MDYEGISAIVVLAVLMIFIIGWLPTRTVDSMKRVVRRRQDKYSPSLHLIDEHSGTRFSDGHSPVTKGAVMRPAQAQGTRVSREHIAEVRRLRRASIRRRRVVVCVLLLACAVVGVLSYVLRFSPLFVLIPAGLLVLTVALGARASRHARAWERKVSALLAQERRAQANFKGRQPQAAASVETTAAADGTADAVARRQAEQVPATQADAVETSLMEQQEIHRAVEQGMAERDRKLALKASRPVETGKTAAPADAADRDHVAAQGQQVQVDAESAGDIRHDGERASASVRDVADEGIAEADSTESTEPSDQTLELSQVNPASSLDVFDMAAGRHQDLISFSWGTPRNVEEPAKTEAPESLEIKSTRQVAKAVPVQEHAQEPKSEHRDDAPLNNAESFHHAESTAHVEVPEETTDSLGHDLRAVLARRSS